MGEGGHLFEDINPVHTAEAAYTQNYDCCRGKTTIRNNIDIKRASPSDSPFEKNLILMMFLVNVNEDNLLYSLPPNQLVRE